MPIPAPVSGLIFNFQPEFIRSDLEFSNGSISLATGDVSLRPSSLLRWKGSVNNEPCSVGPPILSDPRKPCLIKEGVESTSLLF